MVSTILFYIFATVIVLSSLKVITSQNPVHAALFLVLTFVTSACLWIMLQVEFLALTLILVYVGAVMVLFLFVVMMLDVDIEVMRKGFWKNLPLAIILGVIVICEMVTVIVTKPIVITAPIDADTTIPNANKLGYILYTQYSYPVEIASLILLLGLVVATALTLRNSNKNAKYQNIAKQVAVSSRIGRIEMIKMKSELSEKTETLTESPVGDKS